MAGGKSEKNGAAPQRRGTDKRPGMREKDPIPALRGLRIEQAQVRSDNNSAAPADEMVVLLNDPEGWAKETTALSPGAFAVAAIFDGKKNAAQVAQEFKLRYGQELESGQVLGLAEELDQALMLASPHFEEGVRQAVVRYLCLPARPAALSGSAYPADPSQLMELIQSFFTAPEGPGALPSLAMPQRHAIQGMILPHFDLRQGGATYAHGYQALLDGSQADLFVILGVAHAGMQNVLYYVSTKDQETPFGTVPVAKELAKKMAEKSGVESALAEFAHRTEHSVEFQAIWLKALLGQRAGRSFEILPVLCGSVQPLIEVTPQRNPTEEKEYKVFVETLREGLEKSGRRWTILASVDFSHVGPKFDHSTPIDERLLLAVERADRRFLGALERLDAAGFWGEIARTKNARNVDAVLASLTLLGAGQGFFKQGRLLHYSRLLEAPTKSAVSFAAMSFEG